MSSPSGTDMCRIAVLMTCHNRIATTLKCLDAIRAQTKPDNLHLQIYLVDDGCTDGTGDAVAEAHPDTTILSGDGSLYWCGGMRFAWAEAMKEDYDYYLWLNDDTHLYPETIGKMVATSELLSEAGGSAVILAGATCEPTKDVCTYSAANLNGFLTRHAFVKVNPTERPQKCDTINGNCVLVPREVLARVGNFSTVFTHSIGDFDYGLRAGKLGIQSWLLDGYAGECASKPMKGRWLDPELSMQERLKVMTAPTGFTPVREWMVFTWRHAGWAWPVCWLRTWIRAAFPRLRMRSGQ